jgi:hypothetical protein
MGKDERQLLNPKTKRWVKVNILTGEITHKKSSGPYKNIQLASKTHSFTGIEVDYES